MKIRNYNRTISNAYKKIFSTRKSYMTNVSKINGEYKGNNLVKEVTELYYKR